MEEELLSRFTEWLGLWCCFHGFAVQTISFSDILWVSFPLHLAIATVQPDVTILT
jgi:hypothetical protein